MGVYKKGNVWWMSKQFKGKRYEESLGTANKRLAEELYAKTLTAILKGEYDKPIAQDYTFAQVAGEYLVWCERQKSFRSKRLFIKQLVDTFGHLQVRYINTMLLEQFQTDRINKGNKPATINRLIATLKHCIHKGYQWDMVSEDTLKRVRQVKLLEENNRRLRYLSKEECQELISHCQGNTKAIVITALNTGCRKGEILNLKWSEVDLKHGFISLIETKNGERREIPINDTLRAALQGLTRRLDVPYVFFDNASGKPYGDVKRSFNTACRKAGIKDFHFHDLRHCFASSLVMAGVDITTVSHLLGHKSLTMTLRYAHLAPEHLSKAVNMLNYYNFTTGNETCNNRNSGKLA